MHLRSILLLLLFMTPGLCALGQDQTLRTTDSGIPEETAADQEEALNVYRERVRRLLIQGDYEEVLRLTKEFERVFPNNSSLSLYRNRAERRIEQSRRQNLLSDELGGDFVLPSLRKATLPPESGGTTSSLEAEADADPVGLSLLNPEIELREAAEKLVVEEPAAPDAEVGETALELAPGEIESPPLPEAFEEPLVREKKVAAAKPAPRRKAKSKRNPLPFPLWIGAIGAVGGGIIAFFLWRMRKAQNELREITQEIEQTKSAQTAAPSPAAAPKEFEFEEASTGGGLFGDSSVGGAAGIDPITGEDSSPPSSLFDPIVSRNPEDDLFSDGPAVNEPAAASDGEAELMELTPESPSPVEDASDAPIELSDVTGGITEGSPLEPAAAPDSDSMPLPSETAIEFESLSDEVDSSSSEIESLAGSTSEDPFSLINLTLPPEHSSEASSPGDTSSPEFDDIPQLPDESQIVATTPTASGGGSEDAIGATFQWDDSELKTPSLDVEEPETRFEQSLESSGEASGGMSEDSSGDASGDTSDKLSGNAPLEFEIGDADTDVGLGGAKAQGNSEAASPPPPQASAPNTKEISEAETVFDISEAFAESKSSQPAPSVPDATPGAAAEPEPTGSEPPSQETVASATIDLASDSFGDTGEASSQEEIDRFTFKTHSGLGIQFMDESNWDKAVYHLSIAAAIEPGNREVKGHLRKSRRMRKSPEPE